MLPDIIVLDEPTSNLDAESIELLKRILALWKKQNKTIIIAEHRLYWLKDICDRAVYLSDGKIQMDIPMRELTDYSEQKMEKLGFLKVLSHYMPEEFPYHSHWKMEACHNAYWEFVPTVDHIYPVALGGADSEENWATTSMLHNSIKNNWTLEQLNWKLYDAGNYEDWDGLTGIFVELVEKDASLLDDTYIKKWYHLSKQT